MGQQQLLLIILGVIIVGIAIAVGLSLFSAQSVQANKDAMINDINNIAANAYQFRVRPISMGGGGGVYDVSKGHTTGYKIPSKMASNDNAGYTATVIDANNVMLMLYLLRMPQAQLMSQLPAKESLSTWVYGTDFQ